MIGDEVYDVAEWVHKHPGGKVLLTYAFLAGEGSKGGGEVGVRVSG